jgi:hypothetical protein
MPILLSYHSTIEKLVKREFEVFGWLWKKADICPAGNALGVLGVVFEPGSQLYTWYVKILVQTHNDVDRTFYDAITIEKE